ncbi:MAG TPA: ATP-binding cassette domain-containing protein, partial [Roseovarius sp.]|nr:ATP-binding cassette domain-containing protein [Roseovarius sp.]
MRDTVMDILTESPVAADPLLEARGLHFAAGGQTLIHGIDLEITPRKRTLVMGANGSGKSLLLRLLHGLLTPS